jgi:hypothetical protein
VFFENLMVRDQPQELNRIFFAFIGFDAAAAQEAETHKKGMPS